MDVQSLDFGQFTSSTCMHGELQYLKYVKVESIHDFASFEQIIRRISSAVKEANTENFF